MHLIAKLPPFSDYTVVNDDQTLTDETVLASWLVKNQAKSLTKENSSFIDFRAPVEFEALMVPDELM